MPAARDPPHKEGPLLVIANPREQGALGQMKGRPPRRRRQCRRPSDKRREERVAWDHVEAEP
eukprot:2611576-Pyramimonas_sp.AAC.1